MRAFTEILADAKGCAEELENIRRNQPVFPGDVISHRQANWLAKMGYIQRNAAGDWITTTKGDRAAPEVKP